MVHLFNANLNDNEEELSAQITSDIQIFQTSLSVRILFEIWKRLRRNQYRYLVS